MEAKIDLRHMRAFLAIAEERNFTRAALRSHIYRSPRCPNRSGPSRRSLEPKCLIVRRGKWF
ncbi:MAG: LysR family transcriptional regulator [Acidobacteriaceae bacterium]